MLRLRTALVATVLLGVSTARPLPASAGADDPGGSTSTTSTSVPGPTSSTTPPSTSASRGLNRAERAVLRRFVARARNLAGRSFDDVSITLTRPDGVAGSAVIGRDQRERPLQLSARFRLASISKVLLTTVVMQLDRKSTRLNSSH